MNPLRRRHGVRSFRPWGAQGARHAPQHAEEMSSLRPVPAAIHPSGAGAGSTNIGRGPAMSP